MLNRLRIKEREIGSPLTNGGFVATGDFQKLFLTFPILSMSNPDSWVAPDEAEPAQILSEAAEDIRAGRFQVALAKHIWYHENAIRIDPAHYGVRLSFALVSWMELANKFPPALERMTSTRDQARDSVLLGKNVFRSFHEFDAINRRLDALDLTVQLFEQLDQDFPIRARQVIQLAHSALIESERFALLGKYITPEKDLRRMTKLFLDVRDMEPTFATRQFTKDVATLVALLVINGRETEAQQVSDLALQTHHEEQFERELDLALTGKFPPS